MPLPKNVNPSTPPQEFVTIDGFSFRPEEVDGFQLITGRVTMEGDEMPDATMVYFNGYTASANDPEHRLFEFLQKIKKPTSPYENEAS